MKLKQGQHLFLVGIGGSGLSAIARVLLGQGYKVSGSDRSLNSLTEALERDGATVYKGHDAAQIKGADALIITSAVKDDHVEVAAARSAGIPVYKRQDIMADLMEGKTVIAVAGTKGKTTTTSMLVHMYTEGYMYPSYIVGGILGNTGTNAGVNDTGKTFIVEADEYDNMFLGLRPNIAVITNIEWDHPDFFKTPEDMIESFERFISLIPKGGTLVVNADDATSLSLAKKFRSNGLQVVTCGLDETADWRATDIHIEANGFTSFSALIEGDFITTVKIPLPGIHNVHNALAAYVVSTLWFRPAPVSVHKSLETFKPTARRFDVRADLKGIAIVDDYAHNPMSIKAVIEAAKQRYPDRAVWAVWQPHTFSRTQALFDQFVTAFDQADHVLVTDIYAAREAPIEGVNSAAVVAAMHHKDVRHTPTFGDAVKVLQNEVQAPAVIVIMSAGDAPEIGVAYLKVLQKADA